MPKPKFDPTQPFEKMDAQKPKFDPSVPFMNEEQMGEANRAGAAQAGLEHFGNAASLGYLPQLQAGAEKARSLIDTGAAKLGIGPETPEMVDEKLKAQGFKINQPEGYAADRDQNIQRMAKEDKEHPTASLAGSIGGGLAGGVAATPLVAGLPGYSALAGAKAAQGAGVAAKAGALAQRTLGGMYGGAALGAAANPGDLDGEVSPLQLGDRARSGALTGAVSGPLHLAGEGLSSAAGAVGGKFKTIAEKMAARALGPYQRDIRVNGTDGIKEVGREALDNGTIGYIPKGREALAESAENARVAGSDALDAKVDELAGKQAQANVPGMDRKSVGNGLRAKLIKPDNGNPTIRAQNQHFDDMITEYENSGVPSLSLPSVREAKSGANSQINWRRLPQDDIPTSEQFNRALHGEMRGGEERIAGDIDKAVGSAGPSFEDLKTQYGNRAEAAQMTKARSEKEAANRFLGIGDHFSGATGAAIGAYAGEKSGGHEGMQAGAILGGIAGAGGSKLARAYGPQIAAKSSDAIAKLIAGSPALTGLVQKYPGIAPALLQKTLMKDKGPDQVDEQPQIAPALMDKYRSNPDLVDKISDPKLKEQIKKYIERAPASRTYIPEEEAHKKFLEEN